jgi:hypothetical protein
VLVRDVVSQLELVKRYDFLHPLLASGRAVWMNVHALRHLWVGLAGNYPPAVKRKKDWLLEPGHFDHIHLPSYLPVPVMKLVSVVICGDDVEEQDVF